MSAEIQFSEEPKLQITSSRIEHTIEIPHRLQQDLSEAFLRSFSSGSNSVRGGKVEAAGSYQKGNVSQSYLSLSVISKYNHMFHFFLERYCKENQLCRAMTI